MVRGRNGKTARQGRPATDEIAPPTLRRAFPDGRLCRLERMCGVRVVQKQSRPGRRFVQANPPRQPADVVAEVHDQARDQHGPEAKGQRDLIIRRLVKEFRQGKFSELTVRGCVTVEPGGSLSGKQTIRLP